MQDMKRRPDWPDALGAYIASRRAKPFSHRAQHDCARFAAGAVKAQTGANLMAGLRYTSAAGAHAALRAEGGLLAALQRRLPQIAPALARRGDVGLCNTQGPNGHMPAVCVVLGEKLAAPGLDGLVFLPRAGLRAAFRV